MATVLEEYATEEQRSAVRFLWAKGLNAKDINEEMFPVYCGKCLSRKTVHNWVEKRDKRFADDEEVETEVRKWLRQQSKDFLCCGYRRTGMYQC
jgi:transposase-like protein